MDYETVHTETVDGIVYELSIAPDDTPIQGNALASGDDDQDSAAEQEIIDRLDSGDTWAWASVRVRAYYEDSPELCGVDYLGCCSYRYTADFMQPGGYWDDMKVEARSELDTLVGKVAKHAL